VKDYVKIEKVLTSPFFLALIPFFIAPWITVVILNQSGRFYPPSGLILWVLVTLMIYAIVGCALLLIKWTKGR